LAAETPVKRRKFSSKNKTQLEGWKVFGCNVEKLKTQLKAARKSLIFSFVEGTLVKAVKKGL